MSFDSAADFVEHCFQTQNHLILSQIFISLDPESLIRARLTCKRWNVFIKKHVWGTSAGRAALEQKLDTHWRRGFPSTVLRVRCSRPVSDLTCDGSVIVCGLTSGQIEVWDRTEGTLIATLGSENTQTKNIKIGLHSKLIVSGFFTKKFTLWKRSPKYSLLREVDVDSSVFQVGVSEDFIAVSMVNGNINVYKIVSGDEEEDLDVKYVGTVTGQPRAANELSLSKGHLLTSSFRSPLKLWKLEDASFVHKVGNYSRRVIDLQLVFPLCVCLHGSSRGSPLSLFTATLYEVYTDVLLARLRLGPSVTNFAMDEKRLVFAASENIRIYQVQDILQSADGLSPLSEGSIPANQILKCTENASILCQMLLTKDQLLHQSLPGQISAESFWLASVGSDQARSVVVSALTRGDLVDMIWWLLFAGVDLVVKAFRRMFGR